MKNKKSWTYPTSTRPGQSWLDSYAAKAGAALGCTGIYWMPPEYSNQRHTPGTFYGMLRIGDFPRGAMITVTKEDLEGCATSQEIQVRLQALVDEALRADPRPGDARTLLKWAEQKLP